MTSLIYKILSGLVEEVEKKDEEKRIIEVGLDRLVIFHGRSSLKYTFSLFRFCNQIKNIMAGIKEVLIMMGVNHCQVIRYPSRSHQSEETYGHSK